MAFLLTSIDKRPMRLKGQSLLAAVAVGVAANGLKIGRYRGVRSGALINVVGAAGTVFPIDGAAAAFELSKPVPLTLEASASDVPDALDEVFVYEGNEARLCDENLEGERFPKDLSSHWLPIVLKSGALDVGAGWARQQDGVTALRLLVSPDVQSGVVLDAVTLHGGKYEFSFVLR